MPTLTETPLQVFGFLDDCSTSFIRGWAFDPERPNRPVDVEVRLSTGERAVVPANKFRQDLLLQSIGEGRHGFEVKLPPHAFAGSIEVSARVIGGKMLYGSPARFEPPIIEVLAGDVVDNCNLRCPFCVVDYSNLRGLRQMTRETHRKVTALLPAIPDGMAWLSCLHEPTLHSDLLDLVRETPRPLRRRLSFTTNLCKRLDDAFLQGLAESGVHHLRVSLDSRNPELFAALRRGGRYSVFCDNLSRLAGLIEKAESPLRLAFVTVALRDNAREIPELVDYCRRAFRPSCHEVRFPYYLPHLARWGREHALSEPEWTELAAELKPMASSGTLVLSGPFENAVEQFETGHGADTYAPGSVSLGRPYSEAELSIPSPSALGATLPNQPLRLNLRWDGLVLIGATPLVNLNQIEDPLTFFRTVRSSARSDSDEAWAGSEGLDLPPSMV